MTKRQRNPNEKTAVSKESLADQYQQIQAQAREEALANPTSSTKHRTRSAKGRGITSINSHTHTGILPAAPGDFSNWPRDAPHPYLHLVGPNPFQQINRNSPTIEENNLLESPLAHINALLDPIVEEVNNINQALIEQDIQNQFENPIELDNIANNQLILAHNSVLQKQPIILAPGDQNLIAPNNQSKINKPLFKLNSVMANADLQAQLDAAMGRVAQEAADATAAATSPLSGLLALARMPPSFSGNFTESWSDWVTEYENFSQRMKLDDQGRVDNLRAVLTGAARAAYDEIHTNIAADQADIWNHVRTQMQIKFPEDRGLALREVEFLNRVQKPNETPENFATALKDLARKAFRNAQPDERSRQITSQFLRGLISPELRQQLVNTDIAQPSLDDYVRRAMQLQLWAPGGVMSSATTPNSIMTEILAKLTALTTKSADASKNNSTSDQSKILFCSFCKENHFPFKNHTKNNCFRQNKMGDNNQSCQFCHQKGHTAPQCRTNQQPRPIYRHTAYEPNPRFEQYQPRPPYSNGPNPSSYYSTANQYGRPQSNYYVRPPPSRPHRGPRPQGPTTPCPECHQMGHYRSQCPRLNSQTQPINSVLENPQVGWETNTVANTHFINLIVENQSVQFSQNAISNGSHERDTRTIVVNNIPIQYDRDIIMSILSMAGPVDTYHSQLIPLKRNQRAQTAFITFHNKCDADRILQRNPLILAACTLQLNQVDRDAYPSRQQNFQQLPFYNDVNSNDQQSVYLQQSYGHHYQQESIIANKERRASETSSIITTIDQHQMEHHYGESRTPSPASKEDDSASDDEIPRTPTPTDHESDSPINKSVIPKSVQTRQHYKSTSFMQLPPPFVPKIVPDLRLKLVNARSRKPNIDMSVLRSMAPKRKKHQSIRPSPLAVLQSSNTSQATVEQLLQHINHLTNDDGTLKEDTSEIELVTILACLEKKPNCAVQPIHHHLTTIALANQDTKIAKIADNLVNRYHEGLLNRTQKIMEDDDASPVSSPKRYNSLKFAQILFLLIILFLSPLGCHAPNTFYKCGSNTNGLAFDIAKSISCDIPTLMKSASKIDLLQVWVIRENLPQVVAIRCSLHKHTTKTFMNFFLQKSTYAEETEELPISATKCHQAWSTKTFENKSLLEVHPTFWATQTKQHLTFSFLKEKTFTVTNLFIESGLINSADGEHLSSNLDDMAVCKSNNGICHLPTSVIIWNSTTLNNICPLTIKGEYSASISDNFIIIEKLQAALTLSGEQFYCNQIKLYATKQGLWLRFMKNPDTYISDNKTNLTILSTINVNQSIKDLDATNAKFQFLQQTILDIDKRMFTSIWTDLCNTVERQLAIIWQILRLSPTLGIRALLHRDDISASFVGEELMVYGCRQINATITHWDYRVNNTCYLQVPVETENKLWFQIPGTQDLTEVGDQIKCQDRPIGHIRQDDYANSTKNQTKLQKFHITIGAHMTFKSYSFDQPALFHTHQYAKETTVELLSRMAHRSHILERQVKQIMNYTAEMSVDPDVVYQTLSGIGKAVGNIVNSTGDTLITIMHHSTQNAVDAVNGLLKGPLQAVINVAVIGAGIFIIIALIIFIIKYLVWPYLINRQKFKNNVAQDTEVPTDVDNSCVINLQPGPIALCTYDDSNNQEPQAKNLVDETKLGWNESNSTFKPTIGQILIQKYPNTTVPRQWTKPQPHDVILQVLLQEANTAHDTPWSTITVNGKKGALARWDTGASHTVISRTAYDILAKEGLAYPLHPTKRLPMAASGAALPVDGVTVLDLSFGQHRPTVSALVVKNLPCPILLGNNLLYKYDKVSFDWKNGRLHLGDEATIPIFGVTRSGQIEHPVRCLNSEIIQPGQEHILLARIQATDNKTILFEPDLIKLANHNLLAARVVATVTNGLIPIRVCNVTKSPIKMYTNMCIGTATIVESQDNVFMISSNNDLLPDEENSSLKERLQFRRWLTQQKLQIPDDLPELDKNDLPNRMIKFPKLFAKENIRNAQKQQAIQYDKKSNFQQYNIGDQILLRNPRHQHGGRKIAQLPWEGPYIVKDIKGPDVLAWDPNKRQSTAKWIHVNRTKLGKRTANLSTFDNDLPSESEVSSNDEQMPRAKPIGSSQDKQISNKPTSKTTLGQSHHNLRSTIPNYDINQHMQVEGGHELSTDLDEELDKELEKVKIKETEFNEWPEWTSGNESPFDGPKAQASRVPRRRKVSKKKGNRYCPLEKKDGQADDFDSDDASIEY